MMEIQENETRMEDAYSMISSYQLSVIIAYYHLLDRIEKIKMVDHRCDMCSIFLNIQSQIAISRGRLQENSWNNRKDIPIT